MAEQHLRLDAALGQSTGPTPADLAEGLNTDGTPLALQNDSLLASLTPPPPAPGPEFDWGQALASLQGALIDTVPLLQWFFLLYFFAFNGGYLLLNLAGLFTLRSYLREQGAAIATQNKVQHEIPVSIIMPVGNDAATAIARVHAMLQLDYSEFEIILVNDASQNQILEVLAHEFSLAPFPEVYREHLPCKHVNAIHASMVYPGLRLVSKENGGQADALNAALNCARYPLFCNMNTDFVLQRDSLRKMGRAFQNNPGIVAACASASVRLPCTWPALFRIVGHLRNARFAQMWWSRINALLITSRGFGVFHKETVLAAGGYCTDAMNEDMELVARIHRVLRRERKHYHIAYVPDPVCWMNAPESWKALISEHMNEQASLVQSLMMNRQMFFARKSGAVGWLGFPSMFLFGLLGPWLEVLGYVVMTLLWLSGLITVQAFWAFLLAVAGLGVLLSTSALLLDELTSPGERKFAHTLKLFIVALLENFGYRQLTAFRRVIATVAPRSPVMRANGMSGKNCSTSRITAS